MTDRLNKACEKKTGFTVIELFGVVALGVAMLIV